MNIVTESLIDFQDEQLIVRFLFEGFNSEDLKKIQNPKVILNNLLKKSNKTNNNSSRIKLIIAIISLISYMSFPRSMISKDKIKNKAIELSVKPSIEKEDVYNAAKDLIQVTSKTGASHIALDTEKVNILNGIVPNRFSDKKLDQYNKYDKDILKAIQELKSLGEKTNAKLIKAIMLVETGMIPRKNHLGFDGFPQTKMRMIKDINKRYKTNFNKADLYDAKQSAKIIHYLLAANKKSKYVKLDKDAIAAYNWGVGNFSKYKKGIFKMPIETKNYVDMIISIL